MVWLEAQFKALWFCLTEPHIEFAAADNLSLSVRGLQYPQIKSSVQIIGVDCVA